MKKSDLKLLQSNMQKALTPPPKKKDDLSDELSKMFDDGTVLQSEKKVAIATENSAPESVAGGSNAPRPTSAQVSSAHLGLPRLSPPRTEVPQKRKKTPVAADRDFNRRPNSIERDALPAGLFPGTSKKIYDALFLRTRGAHNPTRTIQATRTELMKWAGVGSRNTFLSHMRHLTKTGLVIRRFEVGNNDGAEYEVCIPEEIDLSSLSPSAQLTSAQVGSSQPGSAQNLGLGSAQKVGRAEPGKTIDPVVDSTIPKTSFNTNIENDDDEAFASLTKLLTESHIELSGRAPSRADVDRWREIGEILVTELKMAAARTESISNVPAFLAEHLRRRLWKKDKRQLSEEAARAAVEMPARKFTNEEIQSCPDCLGTGTYYPAGNNPEGWAKGAAKCHHQRLTAQTEETGAPVSDVSRDVSREETTEKEGI